jgi:hypothetical protein
MTRSLKTAPELERLVLARIARHAVCAGISAVTVREDPDRADGSWLVSDIFVPGGVVPDTCRAACAEAVAHLLQEYALLPLDQVEPDDEFTD